MAFNKAIIDWLRAVLCDQNSNLYAAYQFGSSLDSSACPNDVDVVLVAIDGAGEPSWRSILHLAAKMKADFPLVFPIPLSVMVLTPSEWDELDGVIVRGRRSLLG